ncbi:uncharacterized protein C18orf19 homolog A-like [Daphnia pulicaria]|uniref:uncharacterized protein C18orf19 homolog A-like n=1 Tax=Daphnia pulicaria TaxID=35523 RepID=UPI001EEA97D8|nr:uncharacterized protein C18orf19 homolog A-like [Daphnia pulicaria]
MSALVTRCISSVYLLRSHPVLASVVVKFPTTQRPTCDVYRFDLCNRYYSRKPCNSFSKSLHISTIYNAQGNQQSEQEKAKSEVPSKAQDQSNSDSPPAKVSLFQRFKQMYKDYWYVLIPVHVATSAVWTCGFYFAVKNGLDVVALLENIGVGEKIINPLRNSSVGYYALTYALYKVASPARYAVTIGGTTLSINYLTRWGYIKPASKEKMQVFYQKHKDEFSKQGDVFRGKLRQHRTDLKKRMTFGKKKLKK